MKVAIMSERTNNACFVVLLDGKRRIETPLHLFVMSGDNTTKSITPFRHLIEAVLKKNGFDPNTQELNISTGKILRAVKEDYIPNDPDVNSWTYPVYNDDMGLPRGTAYAIAQCGDHHITLTGPFASADMAIGYRMADIMEHGDDPRWNIVPLQVDPASDFHQGDMVDGVMVHLLDRPVKETMISGATFGLGPSPEEIEATVMTILNTD